VTYERPAIEQRVEVSEPVITVAAIGSPSVTATPTWKHDGQENS
jgi:hypothetical protein